jgi:hypothetical protein
LLFKGPGSFKKSFKKCGNVENLKAYRLIPPMTPLFNGWTIPLILSGKDEMRRKAGIRKHVHKEQKRKI